MRIPADCFLLEGMDITVDESIYGEEELVAKTLSNGENHTENPDPFLRSKSLIVSG